ncbi:hypothetical protein D3C78_1773010 [compost metagenome]
MATTPGAMVAAPRYALLGQPLRARLAEANLLHLAAGKDGRQWSPSYNDLSKAPPEPFSTIWIVRAELIQALLSDTQK